MFRDTSAQDQALTTSPSHSRMRRRLLLGAGIACWCCLPRGWRRSVAGRWAIHRHRKTAHRHRGARRSGARSVGRRSRHRRQQPHALCHRRRQGDAEGGRRRPGEAGPGTRDHRQSGAAQPAGAGGIDAGQPGSRGASRKSRCADREAQCPQESGPGRRSVARLHSAAWSATRALTGRSRVAERHGSCRRRNEEGHALG